MTWLAETGSLSTGNVVIRILAVSADDQTGFDVREYTRHGVDGFERRQAE